MLREWTARPDGKREQKEQGDRNAETEKPEDMQIRREPTVATLSFPRNVFILLRKEERKQERERKREREGREEATRSPAQK